MPDCVRRSVGHLRTRLKFREMAARSLPRYYLDLILPHAYFS